MVTGISRKIDDDNPGKRVKKSLPLLSQLWLGDCLVGCLILLAASHGFLRFILEHTQCLAKDVPLSQFHVSCVHELSNHVFSPSGCFLLIVTQYEDLSTCHPSRCLYH